MPQVVIDSEKLATISNQLQTLLKNSQRIENLSYKRYIKQKTEMLDEKEAETLEFIEKHPKTSIQGVVNKSKYARKTVYRIIKNLVRYGVIVKEKDSKSRKHALSVNKRSAIWGVMNDLKVFRRSYFELVNLAAEKYTQIEGQDLDEIYSLGVSSQLVFVLKHLIMGYSLYAVFEWPRIIRDDEGLNRLYLTVFQTLNSILSELAKKVPFHLKEKSARLEFVKKDMMFLYQESKEYEQIVSEFHEYGLDRELDSVMSSLFKALKMPKKWEDYRVAIEEDQAEKISGNEIL
jgi:DNA-binding MarR family transcriptional regulator